MNIQIFMGKKNFDCQKAERWFKERGIRYQAVDLAKKGISPANSTPCSTRSDSLPRSTPRARSMQNLRSAS